MSFWPWSKDRESSLAAAAAANREIEDRLEKERIQLREDVVRDMKREVREKPDPFPPTHLEPPESKIGDHVHSICVSEREPVSGPTEHSIPAEPRGRGSILGFRFSDLEDLREVLDMTGMPMEELLELLHKGIEGEL